MASTVAVLGGTGVFARHLIPRLAAAGHRVRALARRPETARLAAACGAEVRRADIFDQAALADALHGCDIGINLATALPVPRQRGGDFAENDRLRRDGTPIWIAACRAAGVPRVLQQSIALVNSGTGDEWADEDTPSTIGDDTAGRAIQACLDMESTVRGSGLDWTVLRGGLFYGPGTGYDDDWFARAEEGRLRLPATGDDFVSLIHIADMADATARAVTRWPSSQTLIVSDNQPARWRELFGYVAATLGTAPPQPGGRMAMPSCRVRNARVREALAWEPLYSTYQAGLAR